MFGRSKHGWIGLDIGASCIKLAQVVRRGEQLRLVDSAIVPRAESWRDEEMVAAPAVSAANEVASALIAAPQVAGRRTAAVLSSTTCQLNSAPHVESGGSAQIAAIVDELATLDISLRDRVFDYWPALGSKSGQNGIHVLSTSRSWSEGLTADLRAAGLNCQAIDGLPHVLARAVGLVHATMATPIAALDWSYTGATFVLVDRSQPVYVRQLRNCSLSHAIDTIGEQLDLDEHEASGLLQSVDLAPLVGSSRDDVSAIVSDVIEPMLDRLVDELRRTLEHLHNLGKQMTPKRLFLAPQLIYLFGGGGTVGGIERVLSDRLNRQVKCWKLSDEADEIATSHCTPLCLLGSAVALSALAWENKE